MEASTDAKTTESKTTDVKTTGVGETKTVVSIVMDDTENVPEPKYGKNNKISIADAEEHFRARAKRYEQNAESKMCRFRPNVAAPERPIDLVKAGLVYYEFKSEDGEYRYNKTLKGLFDEMKKELIKQRLYDFDEQWNYYLDCLASQHTPEELYRRGYIKYSQARTAQNIYDINHKMTSNFKLSPLAVTFKFDK